ncbi:MAG TPA: YicC/YloC family endoribonuclease, partial [Candidatus Sulfotelmatobacter sp.]
MKAAAQKPAAVPIRSMTGFAQVKGEIHRDSNSSASPNGQIGFSLSLKSVNHRFLDLHFRLPSGADSLEMQLRRVLKEKIARGHVEITVSLERASTENFSLNRELIGGYIAAFRAAATEFSITCDPDLNSVLRIPGAMDSSNGGAGDIDAPVMQKVGEALDRLNQ